MGTPMNLGAITWEAARASGFVAYGLLAASVALGIALSLGWRSPRWPRFVTNETHRFLTLLALVFTGLHTLSVAIDPFVRFSLPEIVIPFASHYRPLWIALGIVGTYLLAAVYASEWVRPRVGYAWWRRFHTLAFAVYLLATLHGLGTGSDSRTPWAIVVYGGSVVVVGALLTLRLLPNPPALARPIVAALCAITLAGGVLWAWSGPLQPGWNQVANNGNGSGGTATTGGTASGEAATTADPSPIGFTVAFSGNVSESEGSGRETLILDATLDGSPGGSFELTLAAADDGQTSAVSGELLLQTATGLACSGPVEETNGSALSSSCREASGASWLVTVDAQGASNSSVQGTLAAVPQPTGARLTSDSPA
jgi:DMSO/TMAO reductase YedYZ heme-binding membrane subunit